MSQSKKFDAEFTETNLAEVVKLAADHLGKDPIVVEGFNFASKSDALYKLIMPRLNTDMATEFKQVGQGNGFELWRALNRKIDPPRSDVAFHMKSEIKKLGETDCKDWTQSVRFVNFLVNRVKEYKLETGDVYDPEDLAHIVQTALDEDTLGKLEDADIDCKDYEAGKKWILERDQKHRARGKSTWSAAKPPSSDAMVYGVAPPDRAQNEFTKQEQ